MKKDGKKMASKKDLKNMKKDMMSEDKKQDAKMMMKGKKKGC